MCSLVVVVGFLTETAVVSFKESLQAFKRWGRETEPNKLEIPKNAKKKTKQKKTLEVFEKDRGEQAICQ